MFNFKEYEMKKILLIAILGSWMLMQAHAQKINPSQQTVNSVIWQQHSGEYKALCYQAFNIAKLSLNDILHTNKDSMPLAIVTDIDETILDNSPDAAHSILNNHGYTDTSWKKWVDLAIAEAMPGAKEFFNYAAQYGVQCFYLSNRGIKDLDATIKNLQLRGFPQADKQHVILKTTTSDKEPRRLEIAKKYNIVLLLGDNLNDFDKEFYKKNVADRNAATDKMQSLFGTKYIVLPNSTYGDWENALWPDKRLNEEEKARIKMQALKGF